MNKLVFLIIVFLLIIKIGLSQEKRAVSFQKYTKTNFVELKKGKKENVLPNFKQRKSITPKNEIYRIEIGKSANAYSFLRTERKPIFYKGWESSNPSNYLSIIFGADTNTYPEANNEGSLINVFFERPYPSEDFWDFESNILINNNHFLRYPSSFLYIPDDTENPEDFYFLCTAFDSIQGSFHHSSFISTQLNGLNYQESLFDWQKDIDEITSGISLSGLTANLSGISYDTIGSFGMDQTLKHYKGVSTDPDEDYNWEITEITPNWIIDPDDGHALALYKTWSAWSNDGEIGYMWTIGVTEESYDYGVYQPQIYHTDDGGETWNYIDFNVEDEYVLSQFLPPCEDENGNPLTVRPSFLNGDQQYPGIVDHQGNLNLFANVYGSTTGDVLNANEANWEIESAPGGHLFLFVLDENYLHEICFIDSLRTKVSTNTFGNIGFNHRLQVAKTNDEYITACTWIDDVWSGADSLVSPDIFAWTRCSWWGPYGPENITENDLYTGFYFFPFLSNKIEYNDYYWWSVELFMTTSLSVNEFAYSNPTDPITHYFIDGLEIGLNYNCFEGLQDFSIEDKTLKVSQNDPNPFQSETRISVNYLSKYPQKISVEIFTIEGINIYFKDEGYIYDHKEITIINEDFKPGIYFYQIRVGEYSITKKMMIM